MENRQLITITEAAKQAPGRPSVNCIWRWCRRGVLSRNGERIRLQHVRMGGRIFTSVDWVNEFGTKLAAADAEYFDRLDARLPPSRPKPPMRGEEQERQEAIERARQILDAAGI